MIRLAGRYIRRELRGGIKGFRILIACLALGVAAIAASGSLKASFNRALAEDSRALLGGDLSISQTYRPLAPDERQAIASRGDISSTATLRAMARTANNEQRHLVELKAVDDAYPLVGQLHLASQSTSDRAAILGRRDGLWGAAADANLLDALGLGIGQTVTVGDATFQIRAVVQSEPDRVASILAFGPRLMIDGAALDETGLVQPGSLVRWSTRLVLPPGSDAKAVAHDLRGQFSHAGWQVQDTSEAAPGMDRLLDNLAAFLTLVGLTALLVGGIGVANAVKAYLDGRIPTIAILKAVGAPPGLILATYGGLVGILAGLGILIGLVAGAAIPWLVVAVAGDQLPLAARLGLYPQPLAVATGFGVLTAILFTLWPLARARAVPATALFRDVAVPVGRWPDRPTMILLTLAATALVALTVLSADNRALAWGFSAAALGALALFRALAWGLSGLAAWAGQKRRGVFAHPTGRLALANLHRPGSAVVSMVLSLGLGLSVLVTIAQVEGNLARQFGERLPSEAPSFFFIDIQSDQVADFDAIVASVDKTAQVDRAPMVRGRISQINGRPVEEITAAPDAQWAIRGDRGLTTAATPPAGTRLVAGQWWAADYQGEPLASVDARVAKGLGIGVGDALTLNILGRDIPVRIASLREIQWSSLNMNFAFVLSPNALAGAPHTWIATIRAPETSDAAIERAVTNRLGNVSAIRVKEALLAVQDMIGKADLAVRMAALVTLSAGALVLGGAVMAGRRRRVRDAVILKVLGAVRSDLWRAWLLEFGFLGAVTGLAATMVGLAASWAVLTQVMRADWVFLPGLALGTVLICMVASLLAGFAGTFWALRAKPAPLLKE